MTLPIVIILILLAVLITFAIIFSVNDSKKHKCGAGYRCGSCPYCHGCSNACDDNYDENDNSSKYDGDTYEDLS